MAVAGLCFLAITFVNIFFGAATPIVDVVQNAAVGILLLGCASLARTSIVPSGAWPWLAALCALTMVTVGQVQVWRSPDGAAFAYVLLIVVAFSPLTLAWAPAVTAAVPMLLGCVVVSRQWPAALEGDWVIAAIAAIAIGMALLWLRLRSVDEMAALTAEVTALATRDGLTGALNRHGIEERAPELLGMAERMNESVFAAFLDVVGLKAVNDRLGHPTGDAVIVSVAGAVRASVRSSDIVGRWGGDEFIVLGVGKAQDPEALRDRILEHIRRSDVGTRLPSLDVSVGTASLPSHGVDVETLIGLADRDMYAHRRASGKDSRSSKPVVRL
jgi:diguanylate cyclase (GGDEF)-like protein